MRICGDSGSGLGALILERMAVHYTKNKNYDLKVFQVQQLIIVLLNHIMHYCNTFVIRSHKDVIHVG